MFRKALIEVRLIVEWISASHWRSFIIIFFLVFGIRAHELSHLSPYRVREGLSSGIAKNLYKNGEFANEYAGATAFFPPIVPAIRALTYHIFGFNTTAAGYARFLISILSTAAIYALLPWLAEKFGIDRQAGVIGALAAAVYVVLIGVLVTDWRVVWPYRGEFLAALMLALLLVGMIGRWRASRTSYLNSILLGLGWGIAFHIKPTLLPIFLGCFGFELWWRRGRKNWIRTGVMVLAVLIACLPWAWRNYLTFGEVFFIRSNLGLELRVGNNDRTDAALEVVLARDPDLHPRHPVQRTEKLLLRDIGEMEYMRRARSEALEWIKANPTEFLRLTTLRFVYFWFGALVRPITATKIMYALLTVVAILGCLRIRRDLEVPQIAALLIPLATFGLIYYVVWHIQRYRIPIDWIFFLLAGSALWYWLERGTQTNESSCLDVHMGC